MWTVIKFALAIITSIGSMIYVIGWWSGVQTILVFIIPFLLMVSIARDAIKFDLKKRKEKENDTN